MYSGTVSEDNRDHWMYGIGPMCGQTVIVFDREAGMFVVGLLRVCCDDSGKDWVVESLKPSDLDPVCAVFNSNEIESAEQTWGRRTFTIPSECFFEE